MLTYSLRPTWLLLFRFLIGGLGLGGVTSCASINKIETLPDGSFNLAARHYRRLAASPAALSRKRLAVYLARTDSTLTIRPLAPGLPAVAIPLAAARNIHFYHQTLDVDILTIPFKIRPSVQGFPPQLNPNFSAAVYMGYRLDRYKIRPATKTNNQLLITGLGAGLGGFLGVGAVTMNPFVTQTAIAYEYDGLVINGGVATIYDAIKFNLGLAVGLDLLLDANRRQWLYQRKPWLGVLFGINLN